MEGRVCSDVPPLEVVVTHMVRVPTGPKKERKQEMGQQKANGILTPSPRRAWTCGSRWYFNAVTQANVVSNRQPLDRTL